ncbi:hypothetical protein KRE40_06975 [Elizabethkingia meningoseptica]|uniref:cupin domain-containing protein n=1 Tax=Elizabethkingia meningoseptica TaxID=238 RepID=UPI0023B005D0|nr:cupin domain-containing protein [Elizabethkingia meningoseptica]MDE5436409.1 hypothetical protein [Elizabethkingia meningoseptica]MDE5508391.1 hypothetical protein [Elizabethkingia meningoseptica]MDE5515081.1 hypothetical protein [Elizabethkingia meningoseptica]MDE5525817.1 hypothetical protein [Elizabethkingia meningoseptica]MDE5529347.1 hypothetical protein [Elizabethkingia meningoseptica]
MENFSTKFWEDFIHANGNFTETCVIKNAITPKMLDDLNVGIMEVLKNRLTHRDIDEGFRVYIDGIEQKDEYLNELCTRPPKDTDDISSYTAGIFNKKFGFIINSGERHSDQISKNILQAVSPLIALKGLPPLGIEITIFIGNYGWTPLGIHQDHRGENVIHFHLGPGDKQMYIWDEDVYQELAGSKHNNTDIVPLLPHAKEFSFGTGDLYYMPWNKYHVGNTEELSVGITLWFNNPSKNKYLNRILKSFLTQFVKTDENIIGNKYNLLGSNNDSSKDIVEMLELDNEISKGSLVDFFDFLTDEFNHNLISNGGWQTPPLSQEQKTGYKVDLDYLVLSDKKIRSDSNFKILYKIKGELLVVYVRGSKFQMQYFSDILRIIDEINNQMEVDINLYLLTQEISIPKEAILYFLGLLYNKRGFEIIN